MNPKWILAAPQFDEVTNYTLDEAEDAIDYLEALDIDYIAFLDADALKSLVVDALRKYPEANFAHWNHGSEDAIYGDDEQPIIDLNNADLLYERECFNSNCSSAVRLGVKVWQGGGIFQGYKGVVSFTTDAAEEFKEAFNFAFKRRVDGFELPDCIGMMKEHMTALADDLVASGNIIAGACMRADRDLLVCYNAEEPSEDTTTCPIRRLGIRLFGRLGWFISRRLAIGVAAQWAGLALMVHDYIEACGKIDYPYQIQGFWWGALAAAIGFILVTNDVVRWMRRQ